MKALVTGVAGFIGSHIAERLVNDGHEVIGIDDLSAGYVENIPNIHRFYQYDICKTEFYAPLLKDVDVVFHNAASKKNICLRDPSRDMEVNGIGTLNLLRLCVHHGIPKFIHASTGSVYGEVRGIIGEITPRNPCSYYGISKTAGESYVEYFRRFMDTTILRYFHVYGERQDKSQDKGGVVTIFSDKIKRGEEITIHGDGLQKRVFTHVSDIVDANIKAWENPASSGQVYNCASSEKMSVMQLANRLMEKYGNATKINFSKALEGDIYDFNVDTRKISRELNVNFKPITKVL
jgi:UDP-glucose 4-epimerase